MSECGCRPHFHADACYDKSDIVWKIGCGKSTFKHVDLCDRHSDAALAAKDEQHRQEVEGWRNQWKISDNGHAEARERVRELEQKLHDLTFEPNGDDSDTMETVHQAELAQIRQQVEAETWEAAAKVADSFQNGESLKGAVRIAAELRRRIPAKGEGA